MQRLGFIGFLPEVESQQSQQTVFQHCPVMIYAATGSGVVVTRTQQHRDFVDVFFQCAVMKFAYQPNHQFAADPFCAVKHLRPPFHREDRR